MDNFFYIKQESKEFAQIELIIISQLSPSASFENLGYGSTAIIF